MKIGANVAESVLMTLGRGTMWNPAGGGEVNWMGTWDATPKLDSLNCSITEF